jgi:hypothetical protein
MFETATECFFSIFAIPCLHLRYLQLIFCILPGKSDVRY